MKKHYIKLLSLLFAMSSVFSSCRNDKAILDKAQDSKQHEEMKNQGEKNGVTIHVISSEKTTKEPRRGIEISEGNIKAKFQPS